MDVHDGPGTSGTASISTITPRPPDEGYKTKDGHVYFGLRRGNSEDWDRLMLTLGLADYIADPRF